MELEPQIAKLIVKSLKDIINHEINLFDTSGTIIASTDTSRIGTSHDGARLAAKNQETLTIDHDNQFEGAKKGINVPVLFNHSVVAIIGITGERSEVEPFGNIIKKMTEILIRENWIQMTNFNQRLNYNNLVSMLIAPQRDNSLTAYLASILDIELNRPRFAVVGKLLLDDAASVLDYEELMYLVQLRMQSYPQSLFSLANQEICLLIDHQEEALLPSLLTSLQHDVQQRFQRQLAFGAGNLADTIDDGFRSYQEAKKTVNWLLFQQEAAVAAFRDMDYGLFLSAISKEDGQQLLDKVFGTLTPDELEQFQIIFDTYTQFNGSIIKCSETLFIHKNTFQNKLNRLAEKTGYNPRNLADFTILSVAFSLRKILSFSQDHLLN